MFLTGARWKLLKRRLNVYFKHWTPAFAGVTSLFWFKLLALPVPSFFKGGGKTIETQAFLPLKKGGLFYNNIRYNEGL